MLPLAFAFLVTSGLALWLSPVARPPETFQPLRGLGPLVLLALWGAGAWLAHRWASRLHPQRDPLLLPAGLLLAGWGGLVIWRLSPGLGARQTLWFVLGMSLLLGILRAPGDLRWLRRYRYVWLSAGLLLTGLTLIFGTHPAGGEPRLWLGCCGFYFQPSEPLRLLLIAFLASFLSDRILAGWAAGATRPPINWVPLSLAWGGSVLLLLAQRDLGMSTLLLVVLAMLLYAATGRKRVLLLAGVLGLVGAAVGYMAFDVVQARVNSWLNPWLDPSGGGYQTVQAAIAMASGGLLGSGPGLGAPGYVPVVQSDFVFAAVAEEWGLLGGLGVLACYAVLVTRGLRSAARARDPFFALLASGICAALAAQTLLILAGTLRLLPITGVTLPFISYGGSSLVTSMIGLGLLVVLSGGQHAKGGEFARPLVNLQRLYSLGWIALALALGWWTVVRGPALQQRSDNQRRALAGRFSPRGRILDAEDKLLAETIGEPGRYTRHYPAPEVSAVLGYDSSSFGQAGVESSLDGYLRGELGPDPLTVAWSELLTNAPPAGWEVRLTLDLELQVRLARLLQGQRGAAVLLDTNSGNVLALASAPSYDPNDLAEDWPDLIQSEDAPLLNRATQSQLQPGLTIAPMLYAWALAQGEIANDSPAPQMTQPVSVGGWTLSCRRQPLAGAAQTFDLALRLGCPEPFADLAERLGPSGMHEMLAAFGLTEAPQIRLEVGQASPPELTEDRATLRQAGVGQGQLLLSPLQLARAFGALAGAGIRPGLNLVEAVRPVDGPWQRLARLEVEQLAVPPSIAQRTMQALGASELGIVDFQAVALSGEQGEDIAWYLGARVAGGPRRVVVVALAGGDPERAAQIAQIGLIAP